jgi:ABC-2 type transport system permease protein
MKSYIRLYFILQLANIRSRTAYPANFVIGTISIGILCLVDMILSWVLTQRVPLIGGWGFYELLFMLSVWRLTHGLFIVTFQQISDLDRTLREGEFDRLLVRPLSPLFQYFTRTFEIAGIGDLVVGIGGLSFALLHFENWGLSHSLLLIVMVISGAAIEWSFFTLIGCTSFWTLQSQGLRGIFDIFLFQFSKFPLTAYSKGVQALLTFVLPVSFITFYPSLFYFREEKAVPFYQGLVYAPPILAVILCTAAYALWKRGINNYKGAGS